MNEKNYRILRNAFFQIIFEIVEVEIHGVGGLEPLGDQLRHYLRPRLNNLHKC